MSTDEPPHFFCDAMLGGLARRLRAAGYEAAFEHGIDDGDLVARAEQAGAVVLSSDRPLFDRRPVREGRVRALFVPRHAPVLAQTVFVLAELGLAVRDVHCMACGGALERADPDALAAAVPPFARARHERFYRCARCARVYWEGTHFDRIADARAEITRRLAATPERAPGLPARAAPRRAPPAPISPLGEGLVARRLRIERRDVLRLGALLAGYDHLASLHDAPDGTTLLVTTPDRARELDDVLDGLRGTVAFETLPLT
jgi:uncharacterized protein with PIN domain